MQSKAQVIVAPTWMLSDLGIVVGIVLCILQGVGVINIGWFWATFPFWICPAVGVSLFLLILIIAWTVVLIIKCVEGVKGLKKRP